VERRLDRAEQQEEQAGESSSGEPLSITRLWMQGGGGKRKSLSQVKPRSLEDLTRKVPSRPEKHMPPGKGNVSGRADCNRGDAV